jgi:HTH-type transcriptional regulator, competence development regulator
MAAISALGVLLRFLREQRGLSLRELGRLAEVDHAYVHRLETGSKESPSAAVIGRLAKALKAGKREANILLYLAAHPDTPTELADRVTNDPTITYEVFTGAASMAFRGKRPNLDQIIQRVRSFMDEEEGNG